MAEISDWLNELAAPAVTSLPHENAERFTQYVAESLAKEAHASRHGLPDVRKVAPAFARYGSLKRQRPRAIPVPRLDRDIVVKIAAEEDEWRKAFELVARNYKAAGYEGSMSCKVRFTPYHALPDSVTFIAKESASQQSKAPGKENDRLLMTMTLVPDNRLLGLPLDVLYEQEMRELRRRRRRMAEVISLAAADDLSLREFRQVFVALIRLMKQYHETHGGDTWVITVNPRHSTFYTKALGYQEFGPQREYPAVQGHPAIAYMLDRELMQTHAPQMYKEIFGSWLPGDALAAPRIPICLTRHLSENSSEAAKASMPPTLFDYDKYFTSPRCW